MRRSLAMLAAVILLSSTHAVAQEYELTRRRFPFFDNTLTIEVVADGAGRLQVVRGQRGSVEVAARVPGGIPAFALGGRAYNQLRLTALGGGDAEFVVIVPEDAHVRVKLPDSRGASPAARPADTYVWDARAAAGQATAQTAPPAPTGPALAYSHERAPRTLNVPNLNTVRTISIRFEGTTFLVAGNQWMSVDPGNPDNVEIDTGAEVQDLIVTVPLETRSFELRLGGKLAMKVFRNEIRNYCQPMTRQDLGWGRTWFTYAPEGGRLSCR